MTRGRDRARSRPAVGDRYVLEAMRAGGYSLGGEQSGHIIMAAHATTGDGVLTALQLAARVAATGTHARRRSPASSRRLPQTLVNVPGVDKRRARRPTRRLLDAVAAGRGRARRHRPRAAAPVGHRAAGARHGRGRRRRPRPTASRTSSRTSSATGWRCECRPVRSGTRRCATCALWIIESGTRSTERRRADRPGRAPGAARRGDAVRRAARRTTELHRARSTCMHRTMRAAPGVGLAAPQIGLPLALAVARGPGLGRRRSTRGCASATPLPFRVLVNPAVRRRSVTSGSRSTRAA